MDQNILFSSVTNSQKHDRLQSIRYEGTMSAPLELRPEDCDGVYLDDKLYDDFVNELAEVPRGQRLTVQFGGDVGPSHLWLDTSGCLWVSPWGLGRSVRAWSASRAAEDSDTLLPTGEWPSSALHRRLVEGGVPDAKATEIVHRLYAKRDCRHVFDDVFVARIIEQNRRA